MKISKQRLVEIIKEELSRLSEEELTVDSLEQDVTDILENSDLSARQLAVINQYITMLKGN
jgi:DNA-directed RNA polymerase sigma subunit (sigma70/sigma32)